ncbi:MAG: hypothetical protein AAF465_08770 [Pseudomonadota bacterium]
MTRSCSGSPEWRRSTHDAPWRATGNDGWAQRALRRALLDWIRVRLHRHSPVSVAFTKSIERADGSAGLG